MAVIDFIKEIKRGLKRQLRLLTLATFWAKKERYENQISVLAPGHLVIFSQTIYTILYFPA